MTTVSGYLISVLKQHRVTDIFGIPGGVVLGFLDALYEEGGITPHLSYNEQAAALEACGFAQLHHRLGAAYATRGPGFTNMISGMVDAFADSLPVVFITAHSGRITTGRRRFECDQEIDTASMVDRVVKYSAIIDTPQDCWKIDKACKEAVGGRKGPVLIDVSSSIWNHDLPDVQIVPSTYDVASSDQTDTAVEALADLLNSSNQPVFLLGDGLHQANAVEAFLDLAKGSNIPVLTSRASQDIGASCGHYFGYLGSHGLRCANKIFSESDAVIALGNRLAFPPESKSFMQSLENKRLIRIDIDPSELDRPIPNTQNYLIDVKRFIEKADRIPLRYEKYNEWLSRCEHHWSRLSSADSCEPVELIADILKAIPDDSIISCDVGNNEFWVSQAYALSGVKNRITYSKSFGVLGCSIAKAIGLYYASRQPVVCFIGDQGLQFNVQEIQLIVQERIPVTICVVNNHASGMIRDRQGIKYDGRFIHTTMSSGYLPMGLKKLADCYGIPYLSKGELVASGIGDGSSIVELRITQTDCLRPNLPQGRSMEDMEPALV